MGFLLYSNPCGHPGKERVGVRWQAEGRWGEADIRGLQSASCSQMTLGCLNQSGVVQVQPRLPIRLTELPGASRVAGLARAELSPPSNPPTTVPNGGQHAKSCHCLYGATASPAPLEPFTR